MWILLYSPYSKLIHVVLKGKVCLSTIPWRGKVSLSTAMLRLVLPATPCPLSRSVIIQVCPPGTIVGSLLLYARSMKWQSSNASYYLLLALIVLLHYDEIPLLKKMIDNNGQYDGWLKNVFAAS